MSVVSAARESDNARENRLRRAAKRQGYAIQKSRSRNPQAIDFGDYMIVDPFTNTVVFGELNSARSLSLDEVEAYLTAPL